MSDGTVTSRETRWIINDPKSEYDGITCTLIDHDQPSHTARVRLIATGDEVAVDARTLRLAFLDQHPHLDHLDRVKSPDRFRLKDDPNAIRKTQHVPQPKQRSTPVARPPRKRETRARVEPEASARPKRTTPRMVAPSEPDDRLAPLRGPNNAVPDAPSRAARTPLPVEVIGDGDPTVNYFKRILKHRVSLKGTPA